MVAAHRAVKALASRFVDWSAWDFNIWTWGWIIFIAFFFVWEFAALRFAGPKETLTWHLRPIFHAAPPTWYIAIGLWLWMGPHFFWPGLEAAIQKAVSS